MKNWSVAHLSLSRAGCPHKHGRTLMRETTKTPPTPLKEFKSSAAQMRVHSNCCLASSARESHCWTKLKWILTWNWPKGMRERSIGGKFSGPWYQHRATVPLDETMFGLTSHAAHHRRRDHLHCQAWAAGPERCVKGGRNTNTGQNIAKSWIIRLSLQANYDFGEDVFSQRDNDPKRCAKAPQNGSKTTRWMIWSQSQDLTTADRLWLLIGIWYEL